MKIKFTLKDGKILTNKLSNATLKNYIISEEGLKVGLDICKHQNQDIWKLLDHKMLYIAMPMDKESDSNYKTIKAFIVRTPEGIYAWSNQYLKIEDGDVIFTEKAEADQMCKDHNELNDMYGFFEFLFGEMVAVAKTIDSLEKKTQN